MQARSSKHLIDRKVTRERKSLKILLIDNRADDVSLLRAAFRALHIRHRLTVARNTKDALSTLRVAGSAKNLPALILLDVKIAQPDEPNGFELLRMIRRKLRVIPIIVLAGSEDERDVYHAYDLGANAYMCKPAAEFVDIIGDFDRFWLRCARLPGNRPA